MKRIILAIFLSCTTLSLNSLAEPEARRLEALFLGSPDGAHRPLERFYTLRRALGPRGINLIYANQPTALSKQNLAKYDVLIVYGNHDTLEKDQETALLEYSNNGGGCVFLHSASECFGNSEAYIKLLGAQSKFQNGSVLRAKKIELKHEVIKGHLGFQCWDENVAHQNLNNDITILQMHDKVPWTWVRTNGKGRVFYTASGHDERCWNLAGYHDLVYRGIMWTAGQDKAKLVENLKLPRLTYFQSKVSIIHAKSWGTPYDRRIPHTHLQNPLPVEDSIKLTQVPPEFELQLFAAEPDIINPIALNWDDKGRLWAVEAYDYPNNSATDNPGLDKIKILEDTDNDGKADKFTTFASGLTICTSALPYRDGCITTDGEEMIYLADTDGDGKSDTRKVLFKGLKIWDTHACTSNLRYGLDNWIYATVGYSGLDIKIGDNHYKSRQGVFRFKPDGSAIEILQNTTNNTWGLGITEEGRVMGSTANNNPSWWLDVPLAAYQQSGVKAKRTPRSDSGDKLSPITFDTLQVDQRERFTAAAGHAIYTSRLFPEDWHNQRALICAPTCKLVSVPRIERRGAGFKTTHFEQNIFASADAWSSPVAAEVGPDGAVYIADWYNPIIQHNVYGPNQKRGKGNAYLTEHRDRKHGRIFRIVPKQGIHVAIPKLNNQSGRITVLYHPDLFWRLTAQRLILEKDGPSAKKALVDIASGKSVATAHALYLLANIDPGKDTQQLALNHLDGTSSAREIAAISALPKDTATAQILLEKIPVLTPDGRHSALVHIAQAPQSETIHDSLKNAIPALHKDPGLTNALSVALARHETKDRTQTPKTPKATALSESAKRGAEVYKTATCVACHQPSGEGVDKTFPPLNKSEWLSRNHTDAIRIVLKGMMGPIKVRGKDYNGGMPAQENLTDQQIADVLNYARNSWDNKLGDITVAEVARVRAELKDRKLPFTSKDFEKPTPPNPAHSYNFSEGPQDTVGHAHATVGGNKEPVKVTLNGYDFSSNNGNRCTSIKTDRYIDLPNDIISKAAKEGVVGELSIETRLQVSENRPWAWAWGFGTSRGGENKSSGAPNNDYLALIPMNAQNKKLRLAARGGGKEYYFDAKSILEPGKMHHLVATFTRSDMALYLNGALVGKHPLPEKLDLTSFKNNNNWLGRSLFNDPVFDGIFKSLNIYPVALNAETIKARAK